MRWKALAVLVVVAVAGCGGDDSDDSGTQSAQSTQSTQPPEKSGSQTELTKLKGPQTKANVIKTLGYTKDGDKYTAPGGCVVTEITWNKETTDAAAKKADPPNSFYKNDAGTAGVQLEKVSYFCAIQAAHRLQLIP
jgi:hypothetical protein